MAVAHPPVSEDAVLAYLAQLDASEQHKLLGRALELREVAPTTKTKTLGIAAAFGCAADCGNADCGCITPVAGAEAERRADDGRPEELEITAPPSAAADDDRPEVAVVEGPGSAEAAEDLMRALEIGNIAHATPLLPQADLSHLGEAGWTCMHWAVHAAAGSLKPAEGKSVGEGDGCAASCCAAGAVSAPGSRAFLRDLIAFVSRRVAPRPPGALVDVRSDDNSTPLMFAADAGDIEACEWLVAAGADASAKDSDGDTAAAWARCRGHVKLAGRLSQLEAS